MTQANLALLVWIRTAGNFRKVFAQAGIPDARAFGGAVRMQRLAQEKAMAAGTDEIACTAFDACFGNFVPDVIRPFIFKCFDQVVGQVYFLFTQAGAKFFFHCFSIILSGVALFDGCLTEIADAAGHS